LVGANAKAPKVLFENCRELSRFTIEVKEGLKAAGVTGGDGAEIDHVEVFGPPTVAGANSKNFVLCPGLDYDRSPCGTGTSAKMASLYKKGELKEGEAWVQESITGSIFRGHVTIEESKIIPHISGSAHVMAQSTLFFDESDPFCWGII
jgi:4-hydroxyproline epimerase